MRFRPRIGDYVFISRGMTIATMTAITGFRPLIGDYFFIETTLPTEHMGSN